ncbi:MAG: hypothetical protein IKD58_03345 [Loktanella sp.]|nr:hypothetical protein [Loktanella sp.]
MYDIANTSCTLTKFSKSEDGAVTVDFVVLTAAIMFIGVVAVSSFNSSAIQLADDTADIIASQLD